MLLKSVDESLSLIGLIPSEARNLLAAFGRFRSEAGFSLRSK